MIRFLFIVSFIISAMRVPAQSFPAEGIKSSFVLQAQRESLKRGLYQFTIQQSFSLPLTLENEHRYQSAFWAISQFMVYNDAVKNGFRKTFAAYHDSLTVETRRAFLEAIYTIDPQGFLPDMKRILAGEKHPKLTAMIMLFVTRQEPAALPSMKALLAEKRVADSTNKIFMALQDHIDHIGKPETFPSIHELFLHQTVHGYKMVYSFQNRNRDHPGIAIIQKADGRFERDASGRLRGFTQLARAASDLPYFITNGNTPQGIYAILGTDTSGNNFIGPTPNLQLALPHEYYWNRFFHDPVDTTDVLAAYQTLVPPSWRGSRGIHESFTAGSIGRTEIIAHGTTIDPAFFEGKPYYPISPTLGCLCAPEWWDTTTGMIKNSEQLGLVNAFSNSAGNKGYLVVLNFFNKNRPLTIQDVEPFVNSFEQKYKR